MVVASPIRAHALNRNDFTQVKVRARDRVAELEAENTALRRALALADVEAASAADRQEAVLLRERSGRAADVEEARWAAAKAEARHGREMAAGRADLAASEGANEALRRANAELAASRVALREREERLRLILDSATDYAIFSMDPLRRITWWNAGAERLLGWAEGEIVGLPADVIFTPEDRESGAPARESEGAVRDGRVADERWHQRKDGSRFWANGLMMPLRDPARGPEAPPLGLIKVMRDETARRRAEEQKTLLLHEMNHRVKNTLAAVQAIALQTVRGAADLPSFAAAFQARLVALARAHDLLTRENWEGAALGEVARAALAPNTAGAAAARVDLRACRGSDTVLPPAQAMALALALHELATNALKHGALSAPGGRVSLACRADPEDGAHLVEWVERGGPPIPRPPARKGFGLRLLQRGLKTQAGMGADLRFEPDGVRCTLRLPPPPTGAPAGAA